MKQETLPLGKSVTKIYVESVDGDLQVVGWEAKDLSAKTDGDLLEIEIEAEKATVRCSGALILYMPADRQFSVGKVAQDLDARALQAEIKVDTIGGDAQFRNVGAIKLGAVAGDLNVRVSAGDVLIGTVGADASLRQIQGQTQIENVGADLFLRDIEGAVSAVTGADAVVYVKPKADLSYSVSAGGDLLMRLPVDVDADFSLQAGSEDGIRVDLPGFESADSSARREFTLGNGSAKISLTAGGDLNVTSRSDEWAFKSEFDAGGRDDAFSPSEFFGIPGDLHKRISQRVEEATRRVTERTQGHGERVQRKVEIALRRAEDKIRAAERRSMHMGVSFGQESAQSRPPVAEPVSDEERLTILRMLQEKKISAQDAETLLSALDGK